MKKHYKDITFFDNRIRLKLLDEFKRLVEIYFENSKLNMVSGQHMEKHEAIEARDSINHIIKKAYEVIRLADIKTYTVSNSLISPTHGRNMDIILNIFNLDRNDIPPNVAIDYIERAIDVYRADRLNSFFRTVNPFFWITTALKRRIERSSKKFVPVTSVEPGRDSEADFSA